MALLLLHGSGGNLDRWTQHLQPFLGEDGISLYAPHYFQSTGTTRADLGTISDGVHVPQWLRTIEAALAFVAARPGVDPSRIVVAGISLGAFLALALAAELSSLTDTRQRERIRALVDISGGLVAPFAGLATGQFPPTLILHGADDNIVPVRFAEELDQLLDQRDVAHRTEILAGEGHWFSAAALPRLLLALSGFLQEHVLSERSAVCAL